VKFVGSLIIAVVFLTIGLGLGLFGGTWAELARTANAPAPTTVQGVIESVGAPIKKSGRRRSSYILPVAYRFEHQGVEYRGETVGRHHTRLSSRLRRSEMEQLQRTLTAGSPATIAFEAADPARNYIPVPSLDARNQRGLYIGSIIAAALTLIGVVSLFDAGRKLMAGRPTYPKPGRELHEIPRQPLINRDGR